MMRERYKRRSIVCTTRRILLWRSNKGGLRGRVM